MRKITICLVSFLMTICVFPAFSQNTSISGNVQNANTKENVAAVSVTVKGGTAGTFTDDKGNFTITTKNLPVTLIVSSVGYDLQEVQVTKSERLYISVNPSNTLGQEVVIAATRVPER